MNAYRRRLGQIKWAVSLFNQSGVECSLTPLRGVFKKEINCVPCLNLLNGHAIYFGISRAQAGMTFNQTLKRPPQRLGVKILLDTQGYRKIIGGAFGSELL